MKHSSSNTSKINNKCKNWSCAMRVTVQYNMKFANDYKARYFDDEFDGYT